MVFSKTHQLFCYFYEEYVFDKSAVRTKLTQNFIIKNFLDNFFLINVSHRFNNTIKLIAGPVWHSGRAHSSCSEMGSNPTG